MKRACCFLALIALPLAATGGEGASGPAFFALSVPDLAASVMWYTETLDLTASRLPGTKEAQVALLQGKGLIVELVQHEAAAGLEERLPEVKGRYLVHGLFKAGFFVEDLDATVKRLSARGAAFKGGAFTDEVLKARSILLLDNNGNVIQLFERLRG